MTQLNSILKNVTTDHYCQALMTYSIPSSTTHFFNDRLTSRVPVANISETIDHFHVELAAPVLSKADFKLHLDRNVLNISVEKQQLAADPAKNYSKREYSYTSWVRSFTLPETANFEQIEAAIPIAF